ncbi:hypothetical protein EYF80_008197 [Liparis tanakae]|uniref:Uncharacterized protein n=1 Tax=Liparis tanakae TaxID=230148 RepID=A0A4Z2IU47_9TELE|nr:hypothetical protein EYF80_008197 [Liparis tanakae]
MARAGEEGGEYGVIREKGRRQDNVRWASGAALQVHCGLCTQVQIHTYEVPAGTYLDLLRQQEGWQRPRHTKRPTLVDQHHAGQVQHHAQTLEGDHSEPQGAILLHQAGRVIPAVGAALAARQALTGQGQIIVMRNGERMKGKNDESERETALSFHSHLVFQQVGDSEATSGSH